jgi:replicative superfamily II helicase
VLIASDIEPLISSLHTAYGGGLEKLILEMICCGRLTRKNDVNNFIKCTLMYIQQPNTDILKWIQKAVTFLYRNQFILSTRDGSLCPSPLGKATTLSGLSPEAAHLVIGPVFFF